MENYFVKKETFEEKEGHLLQMSQDMFFISKRDQDENLHHESILKRDEKQQEHTHTIIQSL